MDNTEKHIIFIEFLKVWNNRVDFPTTADVREELCFESDVAVENFAARMRWNGWNLANRQRSIMEDAEFIKLWADLDRYKEISDLVIVMNENGRTISRRAARLRKKFGIDLIPYRGTKHEYGKRYFGL